MGSKAQMDKISPGQESTLTTETKGRMVRKITESERRNQIRLNPMDLIFSTRMQK
jgi:hypothetical protein